MQESLWCEIEDKITRTAMWKSESVSVLLILLFGSGNFFKMEKGFAAARTNASLLCDMPKACDVPGFHDWFKVGRHCVKYFYNKRLNFTDAEVKCTTTAPGAHLVSVHNKAHNNYLFCIVKKFNPRHLRVWLGGYEFFKTGQFFWLDGSFWNYQAWVAGEPNNVYTNKEECVEMSWKENAMWNDASCSAIKYYICAFNRKRILEVDSE